MTSKERLQRIEDLLGKDGSPEAAEIMAEYLPDQWTDEEWDDALDKTNRRLYGPYEDRRLDASQDNAEED